MPDPDEMLSVEEAREKILELFNVMEVEPRPLLEALDAVLARDAVSSIDIPPLANSAMDGFAVLAADTAGASPASPRRLRVVGDLAAGYVSHRALGPGEALRIMTGAPVPEGSDAVVPFEQTRMLPGGQEVEALAEVRAPANVRSAGEDVRRGQVVVRAGTVLRPPEIGMLASLGLAQVPAHARPRVGILATGDEVIEPGHELGPGKIYNSNSYSVGAQVLRAGGVPVMLGVARDTMDELGAAIERGRQTNFLLSSGGVSVGDYDFVKDVLVEKGGIAFWKVRMKPGKPLAFGAIGGVPFMGLPGNPVSSMVAFEQFARPAILKMQGKTSFKRPEVQAVLAEDVENRGGRRYFVRARVERDGDRWVARTTGPQGSGILMSMALANALLVIPEDRPWARAGETVTAQMLDWPEDAGS